MLKTVALLILSLGTIFGQASIGGGHGQGYPTSVRWQAIYVAATGTTGAITLQQAPYPAPRTGYPEMGWVYCSEGGSFTLEQYGSAATTGQITPEAINNSGRSQMTAFAGTVGSEPPQAQNNVGTGAFVSAPYQIPAGSTVFLDLTNMIVPINGGTGANVTLRAACTSGAIEMTLQWNEQ